MTLARFRAAFTEAVGDFFTQVLVLCARLGMGQLGVVALDGMKITASASKAANRTETALAKLAAGTVARHGQADAEEDELFGPGRRGDEPADGDGEGGGGWSPRRRRERVAAALAGLRAERAAEEAAEAAKAEAFRARQAAGQRTGPAPAGSAVALAGENLARARAARAAQLAALEKRYAAGEPQRRSTVAGVDDYCRVREAAAKLATAQDRAAKKEAAAGKDQASGASRGPVRNVTDPDSRLMPVRGGGFIQGCNTQNDTSQDGLIIATTLTQDTTDMTWFEPMLGRAQQAAALITAHHPPSGQSGGIGLFLADAGYCSEANLTCPGPDRLIAVGKGRDLEKTARGGEPPGPGRGGPAIQAMRERLATEDGITSYRQRGHIAETPHGNIKHNMRFRQLSMRGLAKATAEWTFTTTVHNISKAITTGHLTPQALAQLTAQPT